MARPMLQDASAVVGSDLSFLPIFGEQVGQEQFKALSPKLFRHGGRDLGDFNYFALYVLISHWIDLIRSPSPHQWRVQGLGLMIFFSASLNSPLIIRSAIERASA